MNDDKKPNRIPAFPVAMAGVFGYLAKYSAYNFLTFAILLCFGGLAFAYITFFGGQIPFWNSISSLIPFDASGNATIGASDILWVYSLVSLIFMLLGMAVKAMWMGMRRVVQRMRGSSPVEMSTPKKPQLIRRYLHAVLWRIIISCAVITLIFVVAFAAIPSAKMAEGSSPVGLFGVIGFFYVIGMIFNCVYVLTDVFSDFILDWARSNFPWPMVRSQVA
jgi:hypothetical protein